MKCSTLTNAPLRERIEYAANAMTVNGHVTPGRPLARRRLLVVEDDGIIRVALRAGLRLLGYDVEAVGNGLDALEAVAHTAPDILILDLALPGLNGPGVAEALTREGLRSMLRIIVVSADPDGHDQARAMGADGYLRKPLQLADLAHEIERVLGD